MRTISALFCLGLLWVALPAQEKKSRSPFLPPDTPAGTPAAAESEFEFNGLITAGGRTLVCVTSLQEQRSRWIAVGAQADGIKVVSHDPAAQRITIEQGGRSRSLQLKRSTPRPDGPAPAANNPLPVPAAPLPVATVAEPVPTTNEEKEREARMLVSDLLEIGMIQRKAYEEAQQKKAKEEAVAEPAVEPEAEPETSPTVAPPTNE